MTRTETHQRLTRRTGAKRSGPSPNAFAILGARRPSNLHTHTSAATISNARLSIRRPLEVRHSKRQRKISAKPQRAHVLVKMRASEKARRAQVQSVSTSSSSVVVTSARCHEVELSHAGSSFRFAHDQRVYHPNVNAVHRNAEHSLACRNGGT